MKTKTKKIPKHKPPTIEKFVNEAETKVSPLKNKWNSLNLVGDLTEIREFKAKHKLKGVRIGETIYNFIVEWNKQNPF